MTTPLVRLIGGGNRMAKDGPIPLPEELLAVLEGRRTRAARRKAQKLSRCGLEALTRGGKIFEEMVLDWFRWQGFLPDRRRQVYFTGLNGADGAETRELDGFFPELDLLLESRLSVQGERALRAEFRQVLTSLQVLRHIYPAAQPLVAFVKVGPEPVETEPEGLLKDMRLDVDLLQQCWQRGLYDEFGSPIVPRVVFDLVQLLDWHRHQDGWYVHPSIPREALTFAEERWMWRQRKFEHRAAEQAGAVQEYLSNGNGHHRGNGS